jgi:hypothetical protein
MRSARETTADAYCLSIRRIQERYNYEHQWWRERDERGSTPSTLVSLNSIFPVKHSHTMASALSSRGSPFKCWNYWSSVLRRLSRAKKFADMSGGMLSIIDATQSINFCIRQIRLTLGATSAGPRFIETLPCAPGSVLRCSKCSVVIRGECNADIIEDHSHLYPVLRDSLNFVATFLDLIDPPARIPVCESQKLRSACNQTDSAEYCI